MLKEAWVSKSGMPENLAGNQDGHQNNRSENNKQI
jgi:hypothetical protein